MSNKEERRSYVRFPITLFVDRLELNPETYVGTEIRTAYDLEITEYDVLQLYKQLKSHIDSGSRDPIKLRVIGRLVS